MREEDDKDDALTEEDGRFVSQLSGEIITRIDQTILSKTRPRYAKVARVVGDVKSTLPDIPPVFISQRISKLVEKGLLESQGNLRRMRTSEVRLPSSPLSKDELEEMIAAGDYGTLGSYYESGQGVPKDYKEAMKWYQKAADRGEIWSQLALGRFYLNGYGMKQDLEQACFWFCLFERNSGRKYPLAAADGRNEIAKVLSSKRIEELKKLAEQWKPTEL